MQTKKKFIIILISLFILTIGWITLDFKAATIPYVSIEDLTCNYDSFDQKRFRLGGIVKNNSINYSDDKLTVDFILTQGEYSLSVEHTSAAIPDLFGNDATPRLAVLFNNVSLDKLQEYQEYWDSNLRGKPHRPILISTGEGEGQVKIEKIGLSPNEMSFKQYSQWMLEQIMSVFNMQPLVLGMVTPNTG